MKNLPTIHTPSMPLPLSREASTRIGAVISAADKDAFGALTLAADCLPSQAERQALSDRLRELSAALRSTSEEQLLPPILSLLLALVSRHVTTNEAKATQRIYLHVLSGLPHFAVAAACDDFLTGRAGDGRWMPAPAEIRKVALKHAEPWRRELAQIHAILTAKTNPPVNEVYRQEVAARIKAAAEKTGASLKAARPRNEIARGAVELPKPAEACTKSLERIAAEYKSSPVSLSSTLRTQLEAAEPANRSG
jgi:hypothetical protein